MRLRGLWLVVWLGWVSSAGAAPVATTVRTALAAELAVLNPASYRGKIYLVRDALDENSCTTGGGTYENYCQSTGAAWAVIPVSGATAGGQTTPAADKVPRSYGTGKLDPGWVLTDGTGIGFVVKDSAGGTPSASATSTGYTSERRASGDASLNAAITAIGATPTRLVIEGTLPYGAVTTVPSWVMLDFRGAGMIDTSNIANAVYIGGKVNAAPGQQIFTNAPAGSVHLYGDHLVDADGSTTTGVGTVTPPIPGAALRTVQATDKLCANSVTTPTTVRLDSDGVCATADGLSLLGAPTFVDADGTTSTGQGTAPAPVGTLVPVVAGDHLCTDSLTVPTMVWHDLDADSNCTTPGSGQVLWVASTAARFVDGDGATDPGGPGTLPATIAALVAVDVARDKLCTNSLTAPTIVRVDADGNCATVDGTYIRGVAGAATTAVSSTWAFGDTNSNGQYDVGEPLIIPGTIEVVSTWAHTDGGATPNAYDDGEALYIPQATATLLDADGSTTAGVGAAGAVTTLVTVTTADALCTDSLTQPTILWKRSGANCTVLAGTLLMAQSTKLVDGNGSADPAGPGAVPATASTHPLVAVTWARDHVCTDSLSAPTIVRADANADCTTVDGNYLRGTSGAALTQVNGTWAFSDTNEDGAWQDGEPLFILGQTAVENTTWAHTDGGATPGAYDLGEDLYLPTATLVDSTASWGHVDDGATPNAYDDGEDLYIDALPVNQYDGDNVAQTVIAPSWWGSSATLAQAAAAAGNYGAFTVQLDEVTPYGATTTIPATLGLAFSAGGRLSCAGAPQATITTIARVTATSVVTVDTAAAHGLSTGDVVTILGVTASNFNVAHVPIIVDDADTFHYTQAGPTANSSGGTVTKRQVDIRGPVQAAGQPIFSGCATVPAVGFSNNAFVRDLRPEWWGAVADNNPLTDSTAALQAAAFAGATTGIAVRSLLLSTGNYYFSNLVLPSAAEVRGQGTQQTNLRRLLTATGVGITDTTAGGAKIVLRDLAVFCNGVVATCVELGYQSGSLKQWGTQGLLQNIIVRDSGGQGLRLNGNVAYGAHIYVSNCGAGPCLELAGDGNHYRDLEITPSLTNVQSLKLACNSTKIQNLHIEGATGSSAAVVEITGNQNFIEGNEISLSANLTVTNLIYFNGAGAILNRIRDLFLVRGSNTTVTNVVNDGANSLLYLFTDLHVNRIEYSQIQTGATIRRIAASTVLTSYMPVGTVVASGLAANITLTLPQLSKTGLLTLSIRNSDPTYTVAVTRSSSDVAGTVIAGLPNSYALGPGESLTLKAEGTSWVRTEGSSAMITPGSGTVNESGAGRRKIFKVTVPENLLASAMTSNITIATLPAKTRLYSVVADTTAAFTGGGAASVTLSVGITGAAYTDILAAHDVFGGTGTKGLAAADYTPASTMDNTNVLTPGYINWPATTAIVAQFLCNVNCNLLTTGSVTFYLTTEVMP